MTTCRVVSVTTAQGQRAATPPASLKPFTRTMHAVQPLAPHAQPLTCLTCAISGSSLSPSPDGRLGHRRACYPLRMWRFVSSNTLMRQNHNRPHHSQLSRQSLTHTNPPPFRCCHTQHLGSLHRPSMQRRQQPSHPLGSGMLPRIGSFDETAFGAVSKDNIDAVVSHLTRTMGLVSHAPTRASRAKRSCAKTTSDPTKAMSTAVRRTKAPGGQAKSRSRDAEKTRSPESAKRVHRRSHDWYVASPSLPISSPHHH
jgi:hypothetical protein